MDRIPKLLASANKPPNDSLRVHPVSVLIGQIQLGALTFHVRLADEQAKLNVNMLLSMQDIPGAETRLRDALLETYSNFNVLLRPTEHQTDTSSQYSRLDSYEQIFRPEDFDLDRLVWGDTTRPLPIDLVTCWGDGRLHLTSAPATTLRVLLQDHLDSGRLENLILLRDEQPTLTVNQATQALSLDRSQQGLLNRLLTDKSTAHSMWLRIAGKHRAWYEFHVQDSSHPTSKMQTFIW